MMDYIYTHANHTFCEVNAKYQLHKLLRAISHPLYAKERVFPIREEDTAIAVMIIHNYVTPLILFVCQNSICELLSS